LGVVCFSGALFILLTVTRVREQMVNGIPDCLKHSTAAGIGMFIAFVGMRSAKLAVANPATFVLMVRKVNGAIFRGMAHWPASLLAMPHPSRTFLQLDLRGAARAWACWRSPSHFSLWTYSTTSGRSSAYVSRPDSSKTENTGSGPGTARRCRRNGIRLADRNFYGNKLYRERCWRCRRRAPG
jgi:xanthine/uracil/vitamin C permease (AzgA family)